MNTNSLLTENILVIHADQMEKTKITGASPFFEH